MKQKKYLKTGNHKTGGINFGKTNNEKEAKVSWVNLHIL